MPDDKEKRERPRTLRDGSTPRASSRPEVEPEAFRRDYGTLPGTPEPPSSPRYLCEEHGTIPALDILWRPGEGGRIIATCPYCGRELIEQP